MNEWYPRNMYTEGSEENKHHVEKYGPLSETGYIDYIDRFKGAKFDPDAWMDVFKKSGAKYVIPVGEHHDGFQMYKSKVSHWNAFEKGPCKDIDALLQESAEKYGVRFGISSHRIEHWWFLGNGRKTDSDIKGEFKRGDFYWPSMPDPDDFQDFNVEPAPSEEFMQDWLVRVCEMVDKFLPEVIYFDWWIGHTALKPYLKKGTQALFECHLKQDRWEKDGQKKSAISIIADRVQLLGGKKDSNSSAPSKESNSHTEFDPSDGFPSDCPF